MVQIFQRPFLRGLFLEGLIFEGAYVRREICVSKSIELACRPPGGFYSEGQFKGGFFVLQFWGAYIWRGLYMEGLIFGILRYFEVNLPFLLCFTFYLRAIFQVEARGACNYLEGRFDGWFFCVIGLGGLYLEGLIHEGVYFRNFMVGGYLTL